MIVPGRGCNVSTMVLGSVVGTGGRSGYSIPPSFGDVIMMATVVVF